MMNTVETARGPLATEDLGRVLMHEHIFIITTDFQLNYPEWEGFDEEREVASAIEQLVELKQLGIDSIVDLTVMNMGRFVPRIARIAEQSPLNIVVATGLYIYDSLPMPFHYQGPGSVLGGPELLTDMFVKDITEGVQGTSIKAGILKCATDEAGMIPPVERVVRAVAHASIRTGGTPISTHTHPATKSGLPQVRVFEEEGVDMSRVVIGHSGDTDDLDYLTELLNHGVTLGMDRFGTETPLGTAGRCDVVAELCKRGFADRMVLSHDAGVFNDLTPASVVREFAPDWNYRFISERVLPELNSRGVTDDQIASMLIRTPRRILAGA